MPSNRPRKYELKRRAELQARTRERIVEAAISLHSEVGPARTTISAIAERAGVGRPTVYSHFPNEQDLLGACSGLHAQRFPRPDAATWETISDPDERLRVALLELYAYYGRHESLLANLARDKDSYPPMREAMKRRADEQRHMHEVLSKGRPRRKRVAAAIALALDFETWRMLEHAGLDFDGAADLAAAFVSCA